jgi:hypothetical protein
MVNSFAGDAAGLRRHAIPPNASSAPSFPEKHRHIRGHFGHFLRSLEPVEATGVCYRGTGWARKMQASIRFPAKLQPERFQMTLTTAHIQPIVALIAGIIILIMPRFLNLVVAIYLIFIGLAGLGLFKMLHM